MSPIILATGDLGTQLPCKSPTTCFPALLDEQLTLLRRNARFFVASIFLICAGSETQGFGEINTSSPLKLTCDPSWEVEPSQSLDKAERLFVWDQLLAPSGWVAMASLWMAPVVWTVMQEGARVCYSVSGDRFPNEITLVALRRPLQVNHAGSESLAMLHIKLLLTAALLPMIINHGIQHWPQEVPRPGICCIARNQSQRHAAWIKVQVKLMQFFTKLQIFSDNISRFKREKSLWCWRICDPSF